MRCSKKSQATIFIIIGIVIIAILGIGIFVEKYSSETISDAETEESIKAVSWYDSIKSYLKSYVISGFHYGLAKYIPSINGTCTTYLEGCGIKANIISNDPYNDNDTVPFPSTYTYGEYAFDEDSIDKLEENIEGFMDEYINNISFSVFENQGYRFKHGNVSTSLDIHDEYVLVDVNLSLEIIKGDSIHSEDVLRYRINDRLGWFVREVRSIINESDTIDLYYDITDHDSLTIARLGGTESDIIKVYDPMIYLIHDYLSLNFIRENRPPDANSVFLSHNGSKVDYVFYDNSLTVNCPNYVTGGNFADPDEDDLTYLAYSFDGLDGYYSCGNAVVSVTNTFTDCDVCKDLDVTITDSGALSDIKQFSNVIRCGGSSVKNGCCLDGCWAVGQQGGCGYGHCLWEAVEECTYTICPAGACGAGNEVEMTAVTKERQYADMCNSCGDCICSHNLNPRFKTYNCPASEECGECESGNSGSGSGSSGGF